MTVWDRGAERLAVAGLVVAGTGVLFTLFAMRFGAALLIGAAGAAWAYWMLRDSMARSEVVSKPFPAGWRVQLEARVPFYRALEAERKTAFERDVLIFLSEIRLQGIDGVQVSDELKVFVGASAAMLLSGRPGRELPRVSDVLLYPAPFDDEFCVAEAKGRYAGMAHPGGTVIMSAPELIRSFENDHDGYHVGLHEFAHVLDRTAQRCDGDPWDLPASWMSAWNDQLKGEMKRAGRRSSALRDYAGTDTAECFAVAVEVFFERPEAMRRLNPELHAMLDAYFNAKRKA